MALTRGNFGSQVAGVLVVAGSAVGLGNVWRFPYELGRSGGAVFLIVYILCIVCFGLPLMVSEFAIGRRGQSNSARAYGRFAAGRAWHAVGLLGIITGTLILCYYGVVAGWAVEYLLEAGMNGFAGKSPATFVADFNAFVADPWRPIVCMVLFMGINLAIIVAGVKKGIERASKVLMPILFIIIVILAVASLMLPHATRGLAFLFTPDVSKVTGATFLAAMGQCFYSLSLCMGCLCTYASYFRREDNLVSNAVNAIIIDTVIAILAGVIIFATAFSVGIEPDTGPALVFITLPNVFAQVFAQLPALGYIFSLLFYILLFIATLTSAMGLLEAPTIYLAEEWHLSRRRAATGITLVCIIVGAACSLSMGVWGQATVAGMNIFTLFDSVTARLMLPIGGLLTAIYIGWCCDKRRLYDEVTNGGTAATRFFPIYRFLLRYITPVAIIAIFLNQLGLF